MKITDINSFVQILMQNISNDDDLYDTISRTEDCEIMIRNNSDISFLLIHHQKELEELKSLKLNLISGKYSTGSIFSTRMMDTVTMSNLIPEDDHFLVTFTDKKNGTSVTAATDILPEKKVYISVNMLNPDLFGEYTIDFSEKQNTDHWTNYVRT